VIAYVERRRATAESPLSKEGDYERSV
jgi:hypothetical protein